MSYEIVRAGEQHLDLLAALFDAYRQFYKQSSDLQGARRFLADRMQRDESVLFVALRNREALGFTQLYPVFTSVGMRRIWLLNDLFVTEACRGEGVASALIDAAGRHARATDAAGILLETGIDNRNAQRLYEKLGFRRNKDTWFYYLPIA